MDCLILALKIMNVMDVTKAWFALIFASGTTNTRKPSSRWQTRAMRWKV